MNDHAPRQLERVLLVLDYDGTVTVDECNELILQRFTGDAWRPFEAQARDGSLTHGGQPYRPRHPPAAAMIAAALEAAGIELIAENAISNSGGRGVRLRISARP